jgi:hypothetical protein
LSHSPGKVALTSNTSNKEEINSCRLKFN